MRTMSSVLQVDMPQANPQLTSSGVAIGIDGGASQLKWVLRQVDGGQSFGERPGANPQLIGWEPFRERLSGLIHDALAHGGIEPAQVTSIGMGLAGVGSPEDVARVRQWLPELLPALRGSWVGHDAEAALRQGVGQCHGIVLIAGSGSFCYGRTLSGHSVRAGGWGRELGDEGSAFWIGRQALVMATRMADTRVEVTGLLGELLARLDLSTPRGLVAWANRPDRSAFTRETAAIAPLVIELADAGDRVARQILSRAMDLLVGQVLAVSRRLDQIELEPEATHPVCNDMKGHERPARPLVCAGGLFANRDSFYEGFGQTLNCHPRAFSMIRLREPATLGALELGREAMDAAS